MLAAELDRAVEFDCPFQVLEGGVVVDAPATVYGPSVYMWEGDDEPTIDGHGWEWITGYSGQDRYSGPVMHASEYLGGRMAQDVLDQPGTYVITSVEDPDDFDSPAGWILLRRIED